MNTTSKIRTENLPLLVAKIEKGNKVAKKLGVEEIALTLGAESFVKSKNVETGEETYISFTEVTVVGETPKLPGGWRLIAVVTHELGVSLILNVPGETCADKYRSVNHCDHCGKARRRNDTFVVRNDAGEEKLVGRNCLADFLGASNLNPANIVAYAEFFSELEGFCRSFDEGGSSGGNCGGSHYSTKRVLALTAVCINEFGWVSRKVAEVHDGAKTPTASHVTTALTTNLQYVKDAGLREWVTKTRVAACEQVILDEVDAAIEWAKGLDSSSEFNANLKACAGSDFLPKKGFGIVVYLIAGYRKHIETLRIAREEPKTNEWIGKEGDKFVCEVTLEKVTSHESAYGTVQKVIFLTKNRETLVWWTNTDIDFHGEETWKDGKSLTIKGTIKKCDTWKDWKTTTVTRVKPA